MIRVAFLLPLLLACAPVAPPPPVSSSGAVLAPRGGAPRDNLVEGCRQEATRVVLYRDRGQQMRTDEGDSRVGVQSSIPTLRAETDRLGQRHERDRMAEECVRQNAADQPLPRTPAEPPRPARPPARSGG